MSEERSLSFGEKAVGLTFNPSGDPRVNELKALFAKVIDVCHDCRNRADGTAYEIGGEAKRLWSVAITEAQSAQMWAVKAATWRD